MTLELSAGDLDACVAFYRLLGFEQVRPPNSLAGRAAWLERGGTQVHLAPVSDPVALRRGHVAVVIAEYDATLALLAGAGHAPEPRAEHWGSPRSFVRDPAGNLVELMAWPPPGVDAGASGRHR